jgi:hypothetical protein
LRHDIFAHAGRAAFGCGVCPGHGGGACLAGGESAPIDVALMKDMVKTLAADDMEGRGPSTAVEPKVLNAIIARFKAAGLKPGGEKGGWLQTVPTVEMTVTQSSPLTIGGVGFVRGSDFVATSFRHAPHTEIKDSDLVFVGYGINAPELGWNDYAGVDMHGKVAVILINDPDYAAKDEAGLFKGRRMTYYGRWTYKYEEAARQGARGALIVHDTFPAAYGWNVVQSSWSGSEYYVARPDNAMDQTEANGWIQMGVAKRSLPQRARILPPCPRPPRSRGSRRSLWG